MTGREREREDDEERERGTTARVKRSLSLVQVGQTDTAEKATDLCLPVTNGERRTDCHPTLANGHALQTKLKSNREPSYFYQMASTSQTRLLVRQM